MGCPALSLYDLKPGDHIKVNRIFYNHHMIVVKVMNETVIRVIHKRKNHEAVVEEDIVYYAPDQIILLVYPTPYSKGEIVERARQRIGGDYNLLLANCEHFATEVRTGTPVSLQVDRALKGIGFASLALAVGGGIVVMAAIVLGVHRQRYRNSK